MYKGKPFIKRVRPPSAKIVYDDCPGCGERITVCHHEAWVTNRQGKLLRRLCAAHPACGGKATEKLNRGPSLTVTVLTLRGVRRKLRMQGLAPVHNHGSVFPADSL